MLKIGDVVHNNYRIMKNDKKLYFIVEIHDNLYYLQNINDKSDEHYIFEYNVTIDKNYTRLLKIEKIKQCLKLKM